MIKKIDIKPLYPVLIFTIIGLVSMISFIFEGNNIYFSDFTSDFKNIVFIFGGFFYGVEIYKKYRKNFFLILLIFYSSCLLLMVFMG